MNKLVYTCITGDYDKVPVHKYVAPTLDLWWQMIKKYSKRDQLSFNYAMWKTEVSHTPIYVDERGFGMHRKSPDFTYIVSATHNQDGITLRYKVIPKIIGRIICWFIPTKTSRKNFRFKYVKK